MNTISSVKWGWGLLTIGCLTGAMIGKVICRSHACCSSHTRIPRVLLTPSPTCPCVYAFLTRARVSAANDKGDSMEAPAVIARAEGQTERKERQQQEVRDIVKRLNSEKAAKKLASKAAADSSTVAGT